MGMHYVGVTIYCIEKIPLVKTAALYMFHPATMTSSLCQCVCPMVLDRTMATPLNNRRCYAERNAEFLCACARCWLISSPISCIIYLDSTQPAGIAQLVEHLPSDDMHVHSECVPTRDPKMAMKMPHIQRGRGFESHRWS